MLFVMTEVGHAFLSDAADNVYDNEGSFSGTCEMGTARRALGAIGKFFLTWMRFVARIIPLFWYFGSYANRQIPSP